MKEIPEEPSLETPQPRWTLVVGLAVPLALVMLAGLAVPADAGRFMGISLSIWCLFACAPLVSLCLAICWRYGGGGADAR